MEKARLTLGPILFHWPAARKRDFYFRIADETPVDTVYLGEVVCSKRTPYFERHYDEVAARLRGAGKTVVFSTLAEVVHKRDRDIVRDICARADAMVEANDATALWHLCGRPYAVGPYMNVYNEASLAFLAESGAIHVTLPPELPAPAIAALAHSARASATSLEVQVYGRVPLALSARCYHARAHGRAKSNCRFVCEEDADGLELKTLEGKPFLAVNGVQTLSYACLNLVRELHDLRRMGVSAFRLSPHSGDMLAIARAFRAVLDHQCGAEEGAAMIAENGIPVPFANGFYHQREGYRWVGAGDRGLE
jgi:O2-independent ubiquinone biosynthesis protein UbiV